MSRDVAVLLLVFAAALALPRLAPAEEVDWVARSDRHAQVLLEVLARFSPEAAGSFGVDGLDEEVRDLRPQVFERSMAADEEAVAELEKRLEAETHPLVRQDLEILIQAAEDSLTSSRLNREHLLPYFNVSRTVFMGIRALVDPQVPKERYPAAVVRLKKYAGLLEGHDPITELAKARTVERFGVKGLLGPFRREVEQDLERAESFIGGIRQLLEGTELEGWEAPYDTVAAQLREYNDWLRAELLPRTREDFRLPRPLYEDALRNWGVKAAPEELIRRATRAYMDIRNEMMALAPLVAGKKGYDTTDYREVIRRLKDEVIPGDRVLDFYRNRLADIEKIIQREQLVTLPERQAGIRMASKAETAAQPAPHLDVPRLIGNTGEYPEFVLPLLEKNADGTWPRSDDGFEAGSWTLTAHEARPGHEMQFSTMVESGVSVARALFAFNSANIEGWGLYAEAITKPYLPLDAQLISLQFRLARAARMFLDPMLNLGLITPQRAKRLLMEDVVIGEGWATHEIERYTYRAPGQATAYYYGYSHLQSLRTETELALGERFKQQAFHDFLLSQGLLPPDLLRKAVMEEFVPAQRQPSLSPDPPPR
jgi:hypothetical protein